MAVFISTNAFALEGTGACRLVFMMWEYISGGNMSYSCSNMVNNSLSDFVYSVCSQYFNPSSSDFSTCQHDFYMNFSTQEMGDLCYAFQSGYTHEDLLNGYAADYCTYASEMPYHITFGDFGSGDPEEIMDAAFNDLASTENQGTIRCYNDDRNDQLYLTVCDCGEHMEDLSTWYEPCPEHIYDTTAIGTCFIGDDGTGTTLLCAPQIELLESHGCSFCFCEGTDGETITTDWYNNGAGTLFSSIIEFVDLDSANAEYSNWGSTNAWGCSIIETYNTACDTGYYMTNSNTCSACPADTSNMQTSEYANTDGKTGCYLPKDTELNDSAGKYIFETQDCHYTE